jgi:hypothetical protein
LGVCGKGEAHLWHLDTLRLIEGKLCHDPIANVALRDPVDIVFTYTGLILPHDSRALFVLIPRCGLIPNISMLSIDREALGLRRAHPEAWGALAAPVTVVMVMVPMGTAPLVAALPTDEQQSNYQQPHPVFYVPRPS